MRHAVGDAAFHRQDVDVPVAVVVADKGDRLAVGAESGKRFLPRRACERNRHSALFGYQPQVVGVHEDDVGCAHVRIAQHAGVGNRTFLRDSAPAHRQAEQYAQQGKS